MLIVSVVSFCLFVVATLICHSQGLFDGRDPFGIGLMFAMAIYLSIFVTPSLITAFIWAMWFK